MGRSVLYKKRSRPHISIDPWLHEISLEEGIAFAKKAGFDGIEYMLTMRDLVFGPSKALRLSEKYNMPITSLHQPLILIIQTPSWLFPRMLIIPKQFPHAQLVNHHVSAFMFRKPSPVRALKYKKMFEEADLMVSYESNPGNGLFSIGRQYAKPTYDPIAFQEFAWKHDLPMNLDVCHIASRNYDIVKFFTDNHKLIRLIHLSDFKDGKQHLPLGEGTLPIKKLLQEVKRLKWDGHITFEIFHFPNQQTKKKKLHALEKSLTFVHEIVGK
jgi:hypothetical protein